VTAATFARYSRSNPAAALSPALRAPVPPGCLAVAVLSVTSLVAPRPPSRHAIPGRGVAAPPG